MAHPWKVFYRGLQLIQPGLLPNPDPTTPIASTAASVLGFPATDDKESPPNTQLSHPIGSERYPIVPAAPRGFKFRPIISAGHESVISLPFISGRYYPSLLSHPLLITSVERALIAPVPDDGVSQDDSLWALEGYHLDI